MGVGFRIRDQDLGIRVQRSGLRVYAFISYRVLGLPCAPWDRPNLEDLY